MPPELKKILEVLFTAIKESGLSVARTRAIGMGTAMVKGLRAYLILQYLIQVLCFMLGLSLFFTLYLFSIQYGQGRFPEVSPELVLCGIIFSVTFLILGLTVRQKTWNRALRVEEFVDAALGISNEKKKSSSISRAELSEMIEEILDQKLRQYKKD